MGIAFRSPLLGCTESYDIGGLRWPVWSLGQGGPCPAAPRGTTRKCARVRQRDLDVLDPRQTSELRYKQRLTHAHGSSNFPHVEATKAMLSRSREQLRPPPATRQQKKPHVMCLTRTGPAGRVFRCNHAAPSSASAIYGIAAAQTRGPFATPVNTTRIPQQKD